jgi:protein-disulfide isomerase
MARKKRRKLTKAEARAEAQRRKRRRQIAWAMAGVAGIAALVVIVLIAISGNQPAEVVASEPLRDDIETGITAEGYPYRGQADAPVTIVEYSDYNCPACRDYNTSTAELVDDELLASGQAKYVVQPYALWAESVPIVEAAVCAREGGNFWDFHHLLFANQNLFSRARPPSRGLLTQFAEMSGLDVDQFQSCLDEGRQEEVETATRIAQEELGVTSTPTFFVNGVKTQLFTDEPYIETLRRAVAEAEAAQSSGSE